LGHDDWSPFARLIFDLDVLNAAEKFEHMVAEAQRAGIKPHLLAGD